MYRCREETSPIIMLVSGELAITLDVIPGHNTVKLVN